MGNTINCYCLDTVSRQHKGYKKADTFKYIDSALSQRKCKGGEVSLTLFDSLPLHGRQAALQYSFPNCESVCCSMPSSNDCFLTRLQVSQETDKVVWYTHLFKNFPVCCNPHSQRL